MISEPIKQGTLHQEYTQPTEVRLKYLKILQSSYTKTALETEIARDTASADAVHKLVDGKIGKEDFAQIKDQSDEKKQLYKDISSYFNEIRRNAVTIRSLCV